MSFYKCNVVYEARSLVAPVFCCSIFTVFRIGFPRDVLVEILNLIESVSVGFSFTDKNNLHYDDIGVGRGVGGGGGGRPPNNLECVCGGQHILCPPPPPPIIHPHVPLISL